MTKYLIIILMISSMFHLNGCSDRDIGIVQDKSKPIILFEESRHVEYVERNGVYIVNYQLKHNYPVENVIHTICDRIAAMQYIFDRQTGKWNMYYGDGLFPSQEQIAIWNGKWSDKNGNVVEYYLQYKNPAPTSYPVNLKTQNTLLYVACVYIPFERSEYYNTQIKKYCSLFAKQLPFRIK